MHLLKDFAEANGKTIYENNMARAHKLKIGSLVEVTVADSPDEYQNQLRQGLRLYVVAHTRDCDGTPLYTLSFDKTAYKRFEAIKRTDSEWHRALVQGRLDNGYSEEGLKLIAEPNDIGVPVV